ADVLHVHVADAVVRPRQDPHGLVLRLHALLRLDRLCQHVRDRVPAVHVFVDGERDVHADGRAAHLVVVDELGVELRADADDGEAPAAERDLLADRGVAAEELLLELEAEDADGRLRADVGVADEAAVAGLAVLDGDELRRDPPEVDPARHRAGGDDGAVLADGRDVADQRAPLEPAVVFDAQAAREVLLGALDAVGGLAVRHRQHAVEAEVVDALVHGELDAVEHGEDDHERDRAEDHADEREERAQRMRFHFFETGADRLADVHGYSVLNASIGFRRDARKAGYMPKTSPVPAAKISALTMTSGVITAALRVSREMPSQKNFP